MLHFCLKTEGMEKKTDDNKAAQRLKYLLVWDLVYSTRTGGSVLLSTHQIITNKANAGLTESRNLGQHDATESQQENCLSHDSILKQKKLAGSGSAPAPRWRMPPV